MKILIMSPTVLKHDAVGNDIEAMYKIFSSRYPCKVFAEGKFNKHVDYIDEDMLADWLNDPMTFIVYHHSIYWQSGEMLLKTAKGRIVFKYHNITPADFYRDYYKPYADLCEMGRHQTECFQQLFPQAHWLADSKFNAMDLMLTHPRNVAVCPPFHRIETIDQQDMDEEIYAKIKAGNSINLLFVGRVAPNKGHIKLLEMLHNIRLNYTSKVKLRIIGKFDRNLAGYNDILKYKIGEYRLKNNVEFIGEINEQSLVSYYKGSDFFVSASEHEGFCVPIIEAQYFGLPILTLSSSAIDETIGDYQLILQDDVRQFTAAIEILASKPDYQRYLIEMGHDNFNQRFRVEIIENRFRSIMTRNIGIPLL